MTRLGRVIVHVDRGPTCAASAFTTLCRTIGDAAAAWPSRRNCVACALVTVHTEAHGSGREPRTRRSRPHAQTPWHEAGFGAALTARKEAIERRQGPSQFARPERQSAAKDHPAPQTSGQQRQPAPRSPSIPRIYRHPPTRCRRHGRRPAPYSATQEMAQVRRRDASRSRPTQTRTQAT